MSPSRLGRLHTRSMGCSGPSMSSSSPQRRAPELLPGAPSGRWSRSPASITSLLRRWAVETPLIRFAPRSTAFVSSAMLKMFSRCVVVWWATYRIGGVHNDCSEDRQGCLKGVRYHLAAKPYRHTAKASTGFEWPGFEEDQTDG